MQNKNGGETWLPKGLSLVHQYGVCVSGRRVAYIDSGRILIVGFAADTDSPIHYRFCGNRGA
eukprot:1393097-Amorphochlora_amoeboformis.AAC.2